ncbi:hypothetical protein [Prevotella koreensis]
MLKGKDGAELTPEVFGTFRINHKMQPSVHHEWDVTIAHEWPAKIPHSWCAKGAITEQKS